jgi:O-antigen ligase
MGKMESADPTRLPDPYWRLTFNWLESIALLVSGLICIVLHLTPVINSALCLPLTAVMAFVSYTTPVSAFWFMATVHFVPFKEGAVLNAAQMAPLVWLFMLLVRYRQYDFVKDLNLLWPVVPWYLWNTVTSGRNMWAVTQNPVIALVFAVMACQLARASKGEYLKCLFGFCLGALFIDVGYWANQAGLPVELSDWGGMREGFVRLGTVRADAVLVWPPALEAVAGLVGLSLAGCSRLNPFGAKPLIIWGSIGAVILTFPVLVATMTHSSYVGAALVAAVIVVWVWKARSRNGIDPGMWRGFVVRYAIVCLPAVVLFMSGIMGLKDRALAMNKYYDNVREDQGVAGSRTEVWQTAVTTVLKHPLFGVTASGEQEAIPEGYAETEGYYLSHNVFLDYGRSSGIPGMLFCACFFLFPLTPMLRNDRWLRFGPFLMVYAGVLLFLMVLSFEFYKPIWVFWMLAAMASRGRPPSGTPRTYTSDPEAAWQ